MVSRSISDSVSFSSETCCEVPQGRAAFLEIKLVPANARFFSVLTWKAVRVEKTKDPVKRIRLRILVIFLKRFKNGTKLFIF